MKTNLYQTANMYPILFKKNLHTLIWGTEEWSVSALTSSPSIIANGAWQGMPLPDVIAQHPEEILGKKIAEKHGNELPLLVKFIETHDKLSIQVHPDDDTARRLHGKNGKSEMWYIIDAQPGAYLYAGFKQKLSKEEYMRKVSDGTITDALARHEVHAGDVFFLPAGRIHAICSGIKLAEIQQSSDITYRIYDYKRNGLDGKPRELHTAQALEALDFEVHDNYRTICSEKKNEVTECVNTPFFTTNIICADNIVNRNLKADDSFVINMCLKGECCIRICSTGEKVHLAAGESCLIPSIIADYDLIPQGGEVKLLEAYCPS